MFVRSRRYPMGRNFSRGHLRFMYAALYVLYPVGCILQLVETPAHLTNSIDIAGLVLVVAAFAIFALLASSSLQRQSQEEAAQLDERELAERNRAAYGAHAIFASVVLAGVIYLMIAIDRGATSGLGLWLPETGAHWNAIFWGLLLASLTLPGALLAWGRAPREDDAE